MTTRCQPPAEKDQHGRTHDAENYVNRRFHASLTRTSRSGYATQSTMAGILQHARRCTTLFPASVDACVPLDPAAMSPRAAPPRDGRHPRPRRAAASPERPNIGRFGGAFSTWSSNWPGRMPKAVPRVGMARPPRPTRMLPAGGAPPVRATPHCSAPPRAMHTAGARPHPTDGRRRLTQIHADTNGRQEPRIATDRHGYGRHT